MRVTSKGQVTIPLAVREAMGIRVSETEVEFVEDMSGKWFLKKKEAATSAPSRFRRVHESGKLRRSTEEILRLTRGY